MKRGKNQDEDKKEYKRRKKSPTSATSRFFFNLLLCCCWSFKTGISFAVVVEQEIESRDFPVVRCAEINIYDVRRFGSRRSRSSPNDSQIKRYPARQRRTSTIRPVANWSRAPAAISKRWQHGVCRGQQGEIKYRVPRVLFFTMVNPKLSRTGKIRRRKTCMIFYDFSGLSMSASCAFFCTITPWSMSSLVGSPFWRSECKNMGNIGKWRNQPTGNQRQQIKAAPERKKQQSFVSSEKESLVASELVNFDNYQKCTGTFGNVNL